MKKASIVVSEPYQKNKLFDLDDKVINRDNCMYPFYLLKKEFEINSINLSTQDINSLEDAEIVIYNDMPQELPKTKYINKSYLLIFESELIRSDNWDFDKHKYFHKIFTWKDDIIDNKKYFKFNFSQEIPNKINKNLENKDKLCTLIAGHKQNKHPLELYSKRIEAIRWFENNHQNDFDLYGIGWDKFSSSNKYINYIVYGFKLASLCSPKYSSYKGKVNNKNNTLEKYKFTICYENGKDISGYITEKIFDCLFAGSIPIYWGANNILEHIPQNCFIDKKLFKNYEDLYHFIINMKDNTYLEYLENIEKFLNSDKIKQFSSESFAKVITKNILN